MERRDLLEKSPYQSDEGELIGKHPGDVPSEILSLKFRAQNPLKGIRERCLDCCCGNASGRPFFAPWSLRQWRTKLAQTGGVVTDEESEPLWKQVEKIHTLRHEAGYGLWLPPIRRLAAAPLPQGP
jgi:hypothetical protein